MYVTALATDYDGTLADDGVVSTETVAALERFRSSGRRLILVTGRELAELRAIFHPLDLFDKVVAENGAVLYDPASQSERLLTRVASPELLQALRSKGVTPLSAGRCIIATREPHHIALLEEIRRLGLELEIICNRGALMALPSGINKATGLAAALHEMDLSPRHVVGIGDAENDDAFLRFCGCDASVANALPALRDKTQLVMKHAGGRGVAELIDLIVAKDNALMPEDRYSRH